MHTSPQEYLANPREAHAVYYALLQRASAEPIRYGTLPSDYPPTPEDGMSKGMSKGTIHSLQLTRKGKLD